MPCVFIERRVALTLMSILSLRSRLLAPFVHALRSNNGCHCCFLKTVENRWCTLKEHTRCESSQVNPVDSKSFLHRVYKLDNQLHCCDDDDDEEGTKDLFDDVYVQTIYHFPKIALVHNCEIQYHTTSLHISLITLTSF